MAVNDVLNQLQLLIQGSAPKLIEVTDQSKVAIPFVPGERYTAKVQEQIANGRFLVLIRDQKLDLNYREIPSRDKILNCALYLPIHA